MGLSIAKNRRPSRPKSPVAQKESGTWLTTSLCFRRIPRRTAAQWIRKPACAEPARIIRQALSEVPLTQPRISSGDQLAAPRSGKGGMRRSYCGGILALCLLAAASAQAQKGGFGVGGMLGEPLGASFKAWLSDSTAIDGGVG